ncbi:MAG: glycoside hydrolase domain-containing protein, partial [Planctomycetota bacterium]
LKATGRNVPDKPRVKSFIRNRYPWEGKGYGITTTVYPPFTDMVVDGRTVDTVLRRHTVGDFGLWDQVASQALNTGVKADLLAEPMRYVARVDGKPLVLKPTRWRVREQAAHEVTARAGFTSDVLSGSADITMEYDGMMKVVLTLDPTAGKKVDSFALEIPVKAEHAQYIHALGDGIRNSVNLELPTRTRKTELWTSAGIPVNDLPQNFCSYIFLGTPIRGLCWFTENDLGMSLDHDKPNVKILRRGSQRVLRIEMINTPTVIDQARTIVYGLQAAPVKPRLDEDWRLKWQRENYRGVLTSVNWGSFTAAASHYPIGKDLLIWRAFRKSNVEGPMSHDQIKPIVDHYKQTYMQPYTHLRWRKFTLDDFVTRHMYHNLGGARSFKTMVFYWNRASSLYEDEFLTFQDEWGLVPYTHRDWPDMSIMRRGFNANPSYKTSHTPSYIDYGVYYANEWLKRGIGLYWDNDYLKRCADTRISAAYRTEDGTVQPAMNLWAMREYHKRVWNLLQHWRKNQQQPLEWSCHMTNALVLPVHTWLTATLDHELGVAEPFSPEWIRTETLGVHVGAIPHSLYQLYGRHNPVFRGEANPTKPEDLAKNRVLEALARRTEWGMRVVHEVTRGSSVDPHERWWRGAGYTDPSSIVHHYYDGQPVAQVDNDQVKWIALARPKQEDLVMVLQSWSSAEARTSVTLDPRRLGFSPEALPVDPETGIPYIRRGGIIFVDLAAPYGTRVIRWIDPDEMGDRVLLRDNFEDDVSLQWSYVSMYLGTVPENANTPDGNKVLRFAENTQAWLGDTRVELWPTWPRPIENAAAFDRAEFSLKFRLGKVPEKGLHPLVYLVYGGGSPGLSKHGVNWMGLSDGVQPWLYADGDKKTLKLQVRGAGKLQQPKGIDVPLDTAWHTLEMKTVDKQLVLSIDGKAVWRAAAPENLGAGLGIRADGIPASVGHVDIDDVVIRERRR